MTSFDKTYQELVREILEDGSESLNERSGYVCKMVPGAHFRLDLSKGFPLLTLRKLPLKIFVAEQLWFLLGEKRPSMVKTIHQDLG